MACSVFADNLGTRHLKICRCNLINDNIYLYGKETSIFTYCFSCNGAICHTSTGPNVR